ncbi:MAG: esterase/lipase family protein [Acutalibacteraceae bacterium]
MTKNKYPFIFVHGMMGWGEGEGMNRIFPYWGMVCGNLIHQLQSQNYEAYSAKVGPFNSAWDRACELYALLAGTRVDYGKAHSSAHQHERFGRSHSVPLVSDWGPARKVHLIGHSFGGATIRLLTELLTNGSPEERACTDPDNLSPLFAGGHGDWVCSVTTVSAPHDGSTFTSDLPIFTKAAQLLSGVLFSVLGNTPCNRFYDNYMEQYGLTCVPGETAWLRPLSPKQAVRLGRMFHTGDHVFHDLTLEGAAALNENIHCSDQTYYFSITGRGTKPSRKDPSKEVKAKIMNPVFTLSAAIMGRTMERTVAGTHVDASWRPNDGLVPVGSGRYPYREPHTRFSETDGSALKKGIWYVFDECSGDHGTVIGGSVSFVGPGRGQPFRDAYRRHLDRLITLEK